MNTNDLERDPRLAGAAEEAAQPAPFAARQRVWSALKRDVARSSSHRAWPWGRLALAAVGSVALGAVLVVAGRAAVGAAPPTTEFATSGTSTWHAQAPQTVSTCRVAQVPCVTVAAKRDARFTLDVSAETHVVTLAVQVGAVQVTDADGSVRQVLASQSAVYSADGLREARALEACGDLIAAEARLAELAQGQSLAAEVALYEQSVLRLRKRGDVAGALTLLDEWQQRFPHGALAPEVALSRLEALERLGEHARAAAAAAAFLRDFPGNERTQEVERFQALLPNSPK